MAIHPGSSTTIKLYNSRLLQFVAQNYTPRIPEVFRTEEERKDNIAFEWLKLNYKL